MAAILAEMLAMRAEMNALRQASVGAAIGATPIDGDAPIGVNNEGRVVAQHGGVPQ
jgi:hypothetical protein